ncbi:MAG: hypothetical protein V3V97_22305 [Hyphomicrobiaceae bacterium]
MALGPLGDLLQVRRGSVVATAASDNVLSRHYGDLLRRWRDGQCIRIRQAIDNDNLHTYYFFITEQNLWPSAHKPSSSERKASVRGGANLKIRREFFVR